MWKTCLSVNPKAAVAGGLVEAARAGHQQPILDGLLEVAVGALDGAVLVRDATVAARRLHPAMGAQRVAAPGQVQARILVQVAQRGRKAGAAMLERRAAQRSERVLQSLGQGGIAFAAPDHMGMLEAGAGKPETTPPVIEPGARDGHAEIGHVGEIRQPHAAGFLDLADAGGSAHGGRRWRC